MKRSIVFVGLGLGIFIVVPAHAYKYTFNNKSDKDAEVQFKLAGDMTTNYKTETVKVAANSSASISIPEFWRAGLCIDVSSIMIKFDGDFKKPFFLESLYSSENFDYMVRTKKMAPGYKINAEDGAANAMFKPAMQCFDRTYDFTYHEYHTYPVLKY
jgi:hypothetical protein